MKRTCIGSSLIVATMVVVICVGGCATARYRFRPDPQTTAMLADHTPTYPSARFAVISDPHIYDTTLGTEGEAFRDYLAHDRKLLVESREILQVAVSRILAGDEEFVMVPGDLTKDGTLASHLLCAEALAELEAGGKEVYVVPGNHDVSNPHAVRFTGDTTEPVERVDPDGFARIYHAFGYGEALFRDSSSLSYVAEPVEGLWLLALDSCDYEKNVELGTPATGGRLRAAQIEWIEEVLAESIRRGKGVLAMMHHGVIEHYDGQDKHFGEYVVADHLEVGKLLAAWGVRVVFTGHYHAQDIVRSGWDEGTLYDVETGSLVTYPCPIRFVSVEAGAMEIRSSFVTQIPSFADRGESFGAYALESVFNGINDIAVKTMVDLGMREAEARGLSGQITDAFIAHYRGDERFTGDEMLRLKGLSLMGSLVVGTRKDLVYGLWTDLEPADNDISIGLAGGGWERL